ncbi:hypothetical protein PIB30_016345 [Stylosanthes scabra]|uniref:Uncharacterized protein n=1 Tax=Stylosanthes scabra TaxID=79078 RepID=A0ABU6S7M3_9FABA|nr:hypothetical protein [Stylosanthes scabra]
MRATYERLQQLFIRKGREAMAGLNSGQQWSHHLVRAIEKLRESIPRLRVTHCDRQAKVFTVDELEATEEWGTFIDPVYSMESVFNEYRVEFPPIPDEQFWPEWHGTTVRPNPLM